MHIASLLGFYSKCQFHLTAYAINRTNRDVTFNRLAKCVASILVYFFRNFTNRICLISTLNINTIRRSKNPLDIYNIGKDEVVGVGKGVSTVLIRC